ncbi:MAG: hypothetical protein AAGJ83_06985 [Planctomycetota bacterium]
MMNAFFFVSRKRNIERLRFVFLVVLTGVFSNASYSQEVKLGTAPSNPTRAGFLMDVWAPPVGQEGFRPLSLRFSAVGQSFQRQRNLTIQFRPRSSYDTEIDYQFECQVSLPEGKNKLQKSVMVPQFYRWDNCTIRIVEDGRRIGKNNSVLRMPSQTTDQGQEISVGVIVEPSGGNSGSTFPDLRAMTTVLGDDRIFENDLTERFSDQRARSFATSLASGLLRYRTMETPSLPSDWLGYTQLDVILVSYGVWEGLEKQQPQAAEAILRWVATGGQLWVYGTEGVAADPTSRLSSLVGRSPQHPAVLGTNSVVSSTTRMDLSESNSVTFMQYQPWNGSFYMDRSSNTGKTRRKAFDELIAARHPMVETVAASEMRNRFRVSWYGMGRVVAISKPDPFPGSFQLWNSIKATASQTEWASRQGVDYSSGNQSCWWWVIASVGRPPVTAFIVSNALFVIVMGPILYFWLRKRRRLFLLFFLAPAFGLLTTLGLFAFAFFSDGLEDRARLRQLSWFDGRSSDVAGESPWVDQTRHTYYTVIGRSNGLVFDRQSLGLPTSWNGIHEIYRSNNSSSAGPCEIRQRENGLQFGGDFLRTRTQSQFLTTRSRLAPPPVDVRPRDGGFAIINRTGQRILRFGYSDGSKLYEASGIDVDATVDLSEAAADLFTRMSAESISPRSNAYVNSFQRALQPGDSSLIERQFGVWARSPKAHAFFCVTEVPEAEFAIPDCRQDECVRVIGGYLK